MNPITGGKRLGMDIAMLMLLGCFFGLSFGFVRLCEKV